DSPVENINTDADLTPEDAGEISGGPEHAPDSTESNAPADVASADAADESSSADTPTSAPAKAPASARPPSRFTRGQLVEGTVTSTSPTSITVDLGEGSVGIVPGRELERMSRRMLEDLAEGEKLNVYVV